MNEWKIEHIEYEIEISEKSLKFTISIVHTTSIQIAKAKKKSRRKQDTKIGREKNENEKIDLPTARTHHTHTFL